MYSKYPMFAVHVSKSTYKVSKVKPLFDFSDLRLFGYEVDLLIHKVDTVDILRNKRGLCKQSPVYYVTWSSTWRRGPCSPGGGCRRAGGCCPSSSQAPTTAPPST